MDAGRCNRTRKYTENLDRFIPNRSAMDFDYAHYMLASRFKVKENCDRSPSSQAYQKILAEVFNMNRTRILAFKNKPPEPVEPFPKDFFGWEYRPKPAKPVWFIPPAPERLLDLPDFVDDFYLNLLDWGSRNVLIVALANDVYLYNASNKSTTKLVTIDEEDGPVTSVSWDLDGRDVGIGLDNSEVQIWDSTVGRKKRSLRGGHGLRVGSLAWNENILTTGGKEGKIINSDVRVRDHIVHTYNGHGREVCGLRWSESGRILASGGNENLIHIWDRSMASSNSATEWLYRLEKHTSAVKALAWCPFRSNMLATGGGAGDECIKFWNTDTGAFLSTVNTGSPVSGLIWNKNEKELLSSHGFPRHQLTLWKYPSMKKMADVTGHISRVLSMAQSPDGCTVASAGADELLFLWNVFGDPEVAKRALKVKKELPYSHLSQMR